VAQGKTPAAHKAMVAAARRWPDLASKVLTEPDLVAAARADLRKRTSAHPMSVPMPDSVAPPLDMSLG